MMKPLDLGTAAISNGSRTPRGGDGITGVFWPPTLNSPRPATPPCTGGNITPRRSSGPELERPQMRRTQSLKLFSSGTNERQQAMVRSEVITVSRICDVAAYHMDWMLERMRQGSVMIRDPDCNKRMICLSLSPNHVRCIVWFSKDFGHWLDLYRANQHELHQYHSHIFVFTINPVQELEPGLQTSLEGRLRQLKLMCTNDPMGITLGPETVVLRLGPLLQYQRNDDDDDEPERWSHTGFEQIIDTAYQYGIRSVTLLFEPIKKIEQLLLDKRMQDHGLDLLLSDRLKIKRNILRVIMNHVVKLDGFIVRICQQPAELRSGMENTTQGQCISSRMINDDLRSRRHEQLTPIPERSLYEVGIDDSCMCREAMDVVTPDESLACGHCCAYCIENSIEDYGNGSISSTCVNSIDCEYL
jgi:hypothetical protein